MSGGVVQRFNNATGRWEMVIADVIPTQGFPILPVPFTRNGQLALSSSYVSAYFPVPYRCSMQSITATARDLGGDALGVSVNSLKAAGGTTNYMTGTWTPSGGIKVVNFGAPDTLPLAVNDLVSVTLTTGASATLWADVSVSVTFILI